MKKSILYVAIDVDDIAFHGAGYDKENDEVSGPWFWASGYGLDEPWESVNDCKTGSFKVPLTSVLHLLLLNHASAVSAGISADKMD